MVTGIRLRKMLIENNLGFWNFPGFDRIDLFMQYQFKDEDHMDMQSYQPCCAVLIYF